MNPVEPTRQQLDPAATVGDHAANIVLVLLSFSWATVMTISAGPKVGSPLLLAVALALLAIAGVVVIIASHPLRAPFTAPAHVAVHILVVLAFAAQIWAVSGTNSFVRDDWAPISLGLFLVAISAYRPALEVVAAGTVSAIFVGFITLLAVDDAVTTAPPLAFVITSTWPLLALCYGTAKYSHLVVDGLQRWQRRADVASAALADELRDGIARSVQQDRVTILNRDVTPFFTDLLGRGEVTETDRDRALEIAAAIRSVMVADTDRSWLEVAVDSAADTGRLAHLIEDPDLVATMIDGQQRTALRALVVALAEDPAAERMTIRLTLEHGLCVGVLSASLDIPDGALHAAYDPYFAVLRIVFRNLKVEFVPPNLIVRFSFDRS